jgi:hypothetical protein
MLEEHIVEQQASKNICVAKTLDNQAQNHWDILREISNLARLRGRRIHSTVDFLDVGE